MKRHCRSHQGELKRLNQHMSSRFRARFWRQQRRKWRQAIRSAMPRFDLELLP